MDPDMNKYDLEHVTTGHPIMSAQELQDIYWRAWDIYYSPDHIETLMRRSAVSPVKSIKLVFMILWFYGSILHEGLHPLQAGMGRRKNRTERRSSLPLENPLIFYPRRLWEICSTNWRHYRFYKHLQRTHERISNDPATAGYTDLAIRPVDEASDEHLALFEVTDAARAAVVKAKAARERIDKARMRHDKAAATGT